MININELDVVRVLVVYYNNNPRGIIDCIS